MGWLGGRTKRRDPSMTGRNTRLDLRLDSRDRAGGDPARHSRGSEKPPRKKRGSRGGGGDRGPIKRFFYWMFVLGLWGGLIFAGLITWQFTKLPPI